MITSMREYVNRSKVKVTWLIQIFAVGGDILVDLWSTISSILIQMCLLLYFDTKNLYDAMK